MLSDVTARVTGLIGQNSLAVKAGRGLYAAWVNGLFAHRGMRWRVNDQPIRIDPRVRRFVPPANERPLFEFLRDNIRPGQTVLDVGAFIGIYAVFEARWVGCSGRVVAFEPTPWSRAVLGRHLAMNGVADRVHVVAAAVGRATGSAELIQNPEPYTNRLRTPPDRAALGDLVSVPVVMLDEVCARLDLQPDWIRMDVQGAEFDVLRGARAVLRAGRGRLRLVAEMHPREWPLFGVAPTGADEVLAELGLRAERLGPGGLGFAQGDHALLSYR